MRAEDKLFLRAYLETYYDFMEIIDSVCTSRHHVFNGYEASKLFETAWNDSMLGEMLREAVLEKYRALAEAEQMKREAEEEAEAGEAMVV